MENIIITVKDYTDLYNAIIIAKIEKDVELYITKEFINEYRKKEENNEEDVMYFYYEGVKFKIVDINGNKQ